MKVEKIVGGFFILLIIMATIASFLSLHNYKTTTKNCIKSLNISVDSLNSCYEHHKICTDTLQSAVTAMNNQALIKEQCMDALNLSVIKLQECRGVK